MCVITKYEGNYLVYCHIFPNGKRYVGITCQKAKDRWGKDGNGYKSQMVYRAIQKYGWNNIKHKIMRENISKELAEILEKTLIRVYKTTDPKYGYNIGEGGEGSNGQKGADNCQSVKVILLNTNEIFDCMADAAKQYNINRASIQTCCSNNTPDTFGGHNKETGEPYIWMKYDDYINNPTTFEEAVKNTRLKRIVCINTGELFYGVDPIMRKYNINNRNRIYNSCNNNKCSAGKNPIDGEPLLFQYYEDWLIKPKTFNDYYTNRVLCIETNEVYKSTGHAAKALNVNQSSITAACKGRIKSSAGYHWQYTDLPLNTID